MDVPYEDDEVCDICNELGAFDFYGDYICSTCLGNMYPKLLEEVSPKGT